LPNKAGGYLTETKDLWPAVEGTSRASRITSQLVCAYYQPVVPPLPTKLNRLFRLYSMQRNTPNANRNRRFLDMAMSRPNLELVETARDRITIVADFPQLSPALLFDYWTSIDLLKKWWPPAAELQPELGGTYHFSWPKQDWHLRGKFTMLDRGKRLAFTWKWDHESIDVTR